MATALESASLVMAPCGYEDGTLGSLQPTDGSGDFTFTRGSNLSATRVNAAGNIEKGYENLLLQSNSFNTTWTTAATSVTSNQAGYDGFNNAWKLETTSNGSRYLQQLISINSVQSISIYAKSGTTDFLGIQIIGTGSGYSFFNLSNGTLGSSSPGVIDKNIELVNGTTDWYKCSFVINANTVAIRIYPTNNGNFFPSTTGQNIYIQDAMLNQGLVTYPYIETTTTSAQGGILEDTPRIDYSSGPNGSLLLEPSRSNLIVNSEYFGGYTNSNSTDEANATTSPEGLINATSFLEAATTGQHKLFTSVIFDGSSNYTFSIFAKSNGRDLYVDTQNSNEWGGKAWFDLTAGTANAILGTADIEDFGNGWYRCTVTGASTLSGGNFVELLTSDGSTNSTIGDITKGVYIYGAMVESNASYPSSYIPTYGAAATRTGDVATSTTSVASTGSLSISLGKQQEPYFTLLGESFQAAALVNNIAIAYSPTALKVSINGAIVVNATGTYDTSSLSSLQLGHLNGADQMGGGVKDLIMFNDFLSDTELNALTV